MQTAMVGKFVMSQLALNYVNITTLTRLRSRIHGYTGKSTHFHNFLQGRLAF